MEIWAVQREEATCFCSIYPIFFVFSSFCYFLSVFLQLFSNSEQYEKDLKEEKIAFSKLGTFHSLIVMCTMQLCNKTSWEMVTG